MKDILFRAKRIDNGKWVEGYYAYSGIVDRNYILTVRGICALPPHHWMFDNIEIDKNTLCQYTGLTDKNGNRIWENDIVKHYNNTNEPDTFDTGLVHWNSGNLRLQRTSQHSEDYVAILSDCNYEVIGNIFDNPELNK